VDLRWVRRSSNGLTDRISNEGVDKEGSDLDATWINIPNGQFQTDYTQLVAKDYDKNQSIDDHIEAGST